MFQTLDQHLSYSMGKHFYITYSSFFKNAVESLKTIRYLIEPTEEENMYVNFDHHDLRCELVLTLDKL